MRACLVWGLLTPLYVQFGEGSFFGQDPFGSFSSSLGMDLGDRMACVRDLHRTRNKAII